jgi:hypothetical protein
MKHMRLIILLCIAVIGFSPLNEIKAQSVSVNFSLFQRELSPHGRWINNPNYGQVWVYNDAGFRPYYSNGHWEYTNYGWSWVSDFDWGWAPFHYGRWEYDPFDGWMWIPGYEWASAWVSWSSYDGYYGWAPLGYGVNINVGFGSIPYNRWTFIPRRNICDRDINRYYINPERNYGFRNAVVINNYYEGNGRDGRFMRGPERREVERYTNNRIEERRIDDRERWGERRMDNDNRRNDNDRNGRNNNDRQVRTDNPNNPGNGNFPVRRDPVDENRKPNRDNNTSPPWKNENRGNRQNDNNPNRGNDQQNNFPRRQQQPVERPQRNPADQPVFEQRKVERRNENGNGRDWQKPAENNQRSNGNRGGGRRGNG